MRIASLDSPLQAQMCASQDISMRQTSNAFGAVGAVGDASGVVGDPAIDCDGCPAAVSSPGPTSIIARGSLEQINGLSSKETQRSSSAPEM